MSDIHLFNSAGNNNSVRCFLGSSITETLALPNRLQLRPNLSFKRPHQHSDRWPDKRECALKAAAVWEWHTPHSLLKGPTPTLAATMTFNGTWKVDRSENYDAFMSKMGEWCQKILKICWEFRVMSTKYMEKKKRHYCHDNSETIISNSRPIIKLY